jgi:hypothetical protein
MEVVILASSRDEQLMKFIFDTVISALKQRNIEGKVSSLLLDENDVLNITFKRYNFCKVIRTDEDNRIFLLDKSKKEVFA